MYKLIKQTLLSSLFVFVGAKMALASEDIFIWSEFEQEKIQVFLGINPVSADSRLLKLSDEGLNISPAIMVTEKEIWAAWVDRQDSAQCVLKYAVLNRNNNSIIDKGIIPANNAQLYSPLFAKDKGGKLWLVWSGFDGTDEEIRVAHWSREGWSKEISITDNDVPDTLPAIDVSENGDINIIWEQLSKTGFEKKQMTLASQDNLAADQDNRSFVSSFSFKDSPTIKGHSGRKTMDIALGFVRQQHPGFVADRHANILMGSSGNRAQ